MSRFTCFGKKLVHLCILTSIKLACINRYFWGLMASFCRFLACLNRFFWDLMASFFRFLVFRVSLFWIQVCYFICVSTVGFIALKVLKPRAESFKPKDLDMFFMSVSATTVSSMSTLEMEVFSNTQLVVFLILMALGGEVFVSVLKLHWLNSKFKKQGTQNKVDSVGTDRSSSEIELGEKSGTEAGYAIASLVSEDFRDNSIRYLGYVVWGYFLGILAVGSALISMYLSLVPSARNVLKNKGLHGLAFSVFTSVSAFANGGFVPTNENMILFSKNSGLLLLLIPQILLGNTLYSPCLRFLIWVLGNFTRREELNYLLNNFNDIGYIHLLPFLPSCLRIVTVFGFILIQFVLFSCMEWNSDALKGLNSYQKLVAALFQSVNSRHAGLSIVNLSIISPAILVLYVVMMYLPPSTTFLPRIYNEQCPKSCEKRRKRREQLVENLLFSQLSYLAIFIILICITERKKLREDPLNFSVFNIVIEVISAYGNVGFTIGYSCDRQLKPDGYCKDSWYGFCGRWSNGGKLILILVMFFGRLGKFNMEKGKAWKLL
ncbi:hypothetical protein NE237_026482 [Protea cynaroides]|uniref:Uncharacterized protein n=1 Tax=Protea cynaroides TaxID=273540 RepID=A0A9Q0K178_9MAGN|nr:hypothetical protein NE237_026482 [Protea cynaroides]